jgi:hypothetical protein
LPLDLTKAISSRKFFEQRKQHPLKIKNLPQVHKFLKTVIELSKNYKGYLSHIDNYSGKDGHLVYEEGNPNFNLYKVSPNGIFINYYNQSNDYWKTTEIRKGTVDTMLALSNNKYEVASSLVCLPKNFILFPLQRAIAENYYLESVAKWAKINKVYVVFKEHPCSSEETTFAEIINSVKNRSEYTMFVNKKANIDYLIDKCNRVWTLDSGVGFTATVKGKPVATFRPTDYSVFGNQVSTLRDAALIKAPSKEELHRFLTWYYDVFTIDIDSSDFKERLSYRFDAFYNKNSSIKDLYTWK